MCFQRFTFAAAAVAALHILFTAVEARTVRLPLTREQQVLEQYGSDTFQQSTGNGGGSAIYKSPVRDRAPRWMEVTNITVGTPPQTIPALIDLGRTHMLVPNIDCDRGRLSSSCEYMTLYNASASTTVDNHTFANPKISETFGGFWWDGVVTHDTASIGGVSIDNATFNSAYDVHPQAWVAFGGYSAVIGLPRYPRMSEGRWPGPDPGPFHTMIDRGILDRNLFSLKLPQAEGVAEGELLLGNIDHDAYIGDLVTLPVSDIPRGIEDVLLPSDWHVEMHSISFGSHNIQFPYFHAAFSTDPWIQLPRPLCMQFLREIGAQLGGFSPFPWVDCDARDTMPDLLITLGPNKTVFGLSPYQYIVSWEVFPEVYACWAPFFPIEASEEPPPLLGGAIVLGTAFLRSLYSVFDVDNDTISLAYLEQPNPIQSPPRRYWQAPQTEKSKEGH